ncbi:hypothetical protein OsJ_20432 [Oryza sativa Japonica Group]|uniref:Uncharacterized protein n=1 Tax=Oryza sativa subsp. japonica TaxID=39947 RepID=B9FRY8_ORYSJ|nr:hypothetical protein OsJ_20432 [Oryza sativa Japonica Group]
MPMRARTMYTYHGELAVQGCRPTEEPHGEQRDGTMYTSTRNSGHISGSQGEQNIAVHQNSAPPSEYTTCDFCSMIRNYIVPVANLQPLDGYPDKLMLQDHYIATDSPEVNEGSEESNTSETSLEAC